MRFGDVAGGEDLPMRLHVGRRAQVAEFGPEDVPLALQRRDDLIGEDSVGLKPLGQFVAFPNRLVALLFQPAPTVLELPNLID